MALKNPVFVWHLERRTDQAIYFSFHSFFFPPIPHVLYLIADSQSPSTGFLSMAQDLLWLPLALICTTIGKPAHKHPWWLAGLRLAVFELTDGHLQTWTGKVKPQMTLQQKWDKPRWCSLQELRQILSQISPLRGFKLWKVSEGFFFFFLKNRVLHHLRPQTPGWVLFKTSCCLLSVPLVACI